MYRITCLGVCHQLAVQNPVGDQGRIARWPICSRHLPPSFVFEVEVHVNHRRMMSKRMPSTVTPGANANATPVEIGFIDCACRTISSSTNISETLSMLPNRASTSQLCA